MKTNLKLKRFVSNKRGDAYVIVIVLVAIAFFAVLWYVFFSSDGWVTRVVNATTPLHTSMGSDTHALYSSITTFIDTWMIYFLVITLLVLVIGGIVYVQRRQGEMYLR